LASRLVAARLNVTPLAHYPGEAPADMTSAYAVQDAAISMWPDKIAGWKVGLISSEHRAAYGGERLAGPIFSKQIARADSTPTLLAIIRGGFAAAEAELVLEIGREPSLDKKHWSVEEASAYAGAMYVGVELAGSAFRGINDFGPAVTASDFGNNAGLVIGRAIADWRSVPLSDIAVSTRIDGAEVGANTAMNIPGGPLTAFSFILGHCAERGIRLTPGTLISTGAITGVHIVEPDQDIVADFGAYGAIACRTVDAAASKRAASA
jgi:2-keto-4-pentenoate hydratase